MGAVHLSVPEVIAKDLGFDPGEFALDRVVVADGRYVHVPVIGPIELVFEHRSLKTQAPVVGDECLLGFIPLEAPDLRADPKEQRLVGRHPGGTLHRAWGEGP